MDLSPKLSFSPQKDFITLGSLPKLLIGSRTIESIVVDLIKINECLLDTWLFIIITLYNQGVQRSMAYRFLYYSGSYIYAW